jgi:hypothetical protein
MGVRRKQTPRQPGHHRRAAGHQASPRLLGEIVGAHHETREPCLGIAGFLGERIDVEDRLRRLDHRPDPGLLIGVHVEEPLADALDLLDASDLGHQDASGAGMGRRR